MFVYETNYSTYSKVQDLMKSKEGVCEVMPKARITAYDNGKESITLVCTHTNPNLNCGTGAEDCTRCLDKDKAFEDNAKFDNYLKESFIAIFSGEK